MRYSSGRHGPLEPLRHAVQSGLSLAFPCATSRPRCSSGSKSSYSRESQAKPWQFMHKNCSARAACMEITFISCICLSMLSSAKCLIASVSSAPLSSVSGACRQTSIKVSSAYKHASNCRCKYSCVPCRGTSGDLLSPSMDIKYSAQAARSAGQPCSTDGSRRRKSRRK